MEITELFRSCVKTIHTRNKALGVAGKDKNRILASKRGKNEFIFQAKEITTQITKLRDFLLENRNAYIHFGGHIADSVLMTDAERDIIDATAQRIINTCINLLSNFKKRFLRQSYRPQMQEHFEALFDLIESYLKLVCKIYSEQKAIRVKRSLELRTVSKLHTETKKHKVVQQNNIEESNSYVQNDEEISKEDMQMFEAENEQLYNELNNLTDEVQQIESKVVHIAELQEIFTEKVLYIK